MAAIPVPPGFKPTPTEPPPVVPAPVAAPPVPVEDSPGVKQRIDALSAKLAAAEAAAANAAALQQQLMLANRRLELAAYPQAQHPDVAAHLSGQYEAYASRTGEGAKPFGEWIKSEAASNPLVSPYLTTPTATPATPAPPAPPPNPSAGALVTPAAPPVTAFSEQAVAGMTPAQVRANLPAIMSQLASEGLIAAPKAPVTPNP
jgi:hypothetical protein